MRNPAYNPDIDLDIDAIERGAHDANCNCHRLHSLPVDLIVTHIPGRFVAYLWDEDGRMLLIDTDKMNLETTS